MTNEKIISLIGEWLALYASNSGKKVFIPIYDGTRTSALILRICSEATTIKKGLGTICLYTDHQNAPTDIFFGRSYKIDVPTFEDSEYIICNQWASERDGIVVGAINKTFGKYNRTYSKIVYSMCDIFPVFDLYYSQIIELTDSLWPNHKWKDTGVDDYKMLEFCIRIENSFGIITSTDSPHKHKMWHTFTSNQKKFIADSHQREKKTRHKDLQKPYPKLG